MKTVIRCAALIVAISLIASCLFSCEIIFGTDPTEAINGAEAALKSAPYTVDMGILFESEDEEMQAVIDSFASPVIKLKADGDDLYMTMSLKLEDRKASTTYTLIDGTVYAEYYEQTDKGDKTEKEKFNCTAEMKEEIIDELGSDANLRYDDFSESVARKVNGVTVITCTNIKSDALRGVVEMLKEKLEGINAAVAVRDANLAIQIKDGKYDVSIFKCTYVITTETQVYSISMTYASQFDYASDVVITAPADADEYDSVEFD